MKTTLPSVDYLLYFGRFNIAHVGYLLVIKTALAFIAPTYGITLIPAPDQPTWGEYTLPFSHRLAMLKSAISTELTIDEQQQIMISMIELELLDRGIKGNYSINVVKHFCKTIAPKKTLGIVMGADAATTFHQWKDWEELLELTHLYIVPRADLQTESDVFSQLSPQLYPYLSPKNKLPSIFFIPLQTHTFATHASSSAVLAGHKEYLPPAVATYTSAQSLL